MPKVHAVKVADSNGGSTIGLWDIMIGIDHTHKAWVALGGTGCKSLWAFCFFSGRQEGARSAGKYIFP